MKLPHPGTVTFTVTGGALVGAGYVASRRIDESDKPERTQVGTEIGESCGASPFIILTRPACAARSRRVSRSASPARRTSASVIVYACRRTFSRS